MQNEASQPLLIVGASVRAAAQSANRAGYRVWAADLFADADLQSVANARAVSRYPTELLSWLAKAPDAPWLYTGALENYPALLQRMARFRPLWGNSAEVVRRVRNPVLLSQVLPQHGVSFPPTIKADARQHVQNFPPNQWLVKPQRSGGGSEVSWFDDAQQLNRRGRWYLQQYVPGVPCSAVYVAVHGRAVLLGMTRQLIGASWLHSTGFHYTGSIGPIPLLPTQQAELQRIGNVLAREFSLKGLFGVDLVQPSDGAGKFSVIEINPRYTASIEIIEPGFSCSAITCHAVACSEGTLPDQSSLTLPNDRYFAKGVLFAHDDTVFRAEIVDYVRQQNMYRPTPAIADIPHLDTPIYRGQPIVTLFAAASSEPSAEAKLHQAVIDFEQVLYHA